MSANDTAKRHFDAAMGEAKAAGDDIDATARCVLNLAVAKFLEYRTVKDVRSELAFIAENCDPDTDFEFMRP
jgi:hypothetical protein